MGRLLVDLAKKRVGIIDGHFARAPDVAELLERFGVSQVGDDARQDLSVDGQRSHRDPVGGFLAQIELAVPPSDELDRGAAAADHDRTRA